LLLAIGSGHKEKNQQGENNVSVIHVLHKRDFKCWLTAYSFKYKFFVPSLTGVIFIFVLFAFLLKVIWQHGTNIDIESFAGLRVIQITYQSDKTTAWA
jgi:hypothetical protein